jgi:hypothetical protein
LVFLRRLRRMRRNGIESTFGVEGVVVGCDARHPSPLEPPPTPSRGSTALPVEPLPLDTSTSAHPVQSPGPPLRAPSGHHPHKDEPLPIECNEPISKEIPPDVVRVLLKLLESYGVPLPERLTWLYAQTELLAQLRAARKEMTNDR